MGPRPANPNAVETHFDEWTKAVAHGLTRRKTLELIGGTFTGAFLALSGSKARAATTAPTTGGGNGCGQICAPLFNPRNQANFNACTQACEDCKSCHGS